MNTEENIEQEKSDVDESNEVVTKEESENRNSVSQKAEASSQEEHIQDLTRVWEQMESETADKKNIIIQYRIDNNYGIISGSNAKFENIYMKGQTLKESEKENSDDVLSDQKLLSQWITDNYQSNLVSFLVSCIVFDGLPHLWIEEAAGKLYGLLNPEDKTTGTIITERNLAEIGLLKRDGELNTHTGKIKVKIIQLREKEYRSKALDCIWKEFLPMREKIVLWLKSYTYSSGILMSKRATQTMGELASLDYYYFMKDMINLVLKNDNIVNDITIAQILISLNQYDEYKENANNMLRNWSRCDGVHFLLTNLITCAGLEDKKTILEDTVCNYLEKAFAGIEEEIENAYLRHIYDFFACGMRKVRFYRIIVNWMYEKMCDNVSNKRTRDISEFFLRIFIADCSLMRSDANENAILIALCSTREDSEKLCYLWRSIWNCWDYKESFYNLLGKYSSQAKKNDSEMKEFIRRILGTEYSEVLGNDILYRIHRAQKRERI